MPRTRPYLAPSSRPRFMPPGQVSLDTNHPLVKDCIGLWLACGGKMKDYRPVSSAVSHDSIFGSAAPLADCLPSDIGLVMDCAPSNANAFATAGWSSIAGADAVTYNVTTASVECWFMLKVMPTGATDNPVLVNRSESASNQNGIGFYINYVSAGVARIAANTRNATTSTDVVGESGSIRTNYWHHAVFTFASNGTLYLYLDGRLAGTTGSAVTFTFNGQPIYFGAHSQIAGTFFNGWNGRIAKVAWYNRQLNDADVLELAKSPMAMLKGPGYPFFNAGFTDPSTVFPVDFADTLTWAEDVNDPTGVSAALLLSDAFIAGDVSSVVDESFADALTWTGNPIEDQAIFDTLSWSGDEQATFTLPDVYDVKNDTLHWGDRFTANSDELSNGRYRR